jgi:hypothetical protein
MISAMLHAQVAARVSRELYREFSVVLPEPVIAACVRDTLVDLHGLISTEALPEMAAALAKVRLTGMTDARSHTRVRRSPTRGPSGSRRGRRTSGLGATPGRKTHEHGQDDTTRCAVPGLPGEPPPAGTAGDTQHRSRPGGRRSAHVRQPAPAVGPGVPVARAPPRRMPVHGAARAIAPPPPAEPPAGTANAVAAPRSSSKRSVRDLDALSSAVASGGPARACARRVAARGKRVARR